MRKVYIGVEIGATKQQIALVDERQQVLDAIIGKILLPRGARDILDWIGETLPRMLADTTVQGIGVGFGGVVYNPPGHTLHSMQVEGWDDFPLRDWVEETFSLPCEVYNDTYCGGYRELLLGAGRDAERFIYSNIGSGIGGAFFPNRLPLQGNGYGSAYLGQTYIPDRASREPGAFRKVEEACSGLAIEARLRSPGYVPADSSLYALAKDDPAGLTCRQLGEAARQGDAFATAEILSVAEDYSIGLANLVTLLSPDVVAIGGGVAHLGEQLLQPMRRCTDALVFLSAKGRFVIRSCELTDSAVAVGAALMMQHQITQC